MRRRALHDARKREVGEHEARRQIGALGLTLAPRTDLLRDTTRLAAQLATALDAPPRGLGIGTTMRAQAAFFALVARPRDATQLGEPVEQRVVQRGEVLDIGHGVRALVGRQRPAGPVGEPIALGEAHAEDALAERRERWRAVAEEAARDLGVEEMRRAHATRTFEDREVLVAGMGDEHARSGEHGASGATSTAIGSMRARPPGHAICTRARRG